MTDLTRREALQLLSVASITAAFSWSPADVERAARLARSAQAFRPAFFTPAEWETVRVLADLLIPRDARSGSATDALVPEFMDFMMTDRPDAQTAMRGGLAWLDAECRDRFERGFSACDEAQRIAVLDDIAWPRRAKPEHSHGVAFFNAFRDLTASGFWSSRIGVEDLQYLGNAFVTDWRGCPPEALAKLGVRYP